MARTAPLTDTAAYVLPFAVFIGFLVVNAYGPVPQWARFVVEMALIFYVSRAPLAGMPTRPLASIVVGVAVFLIWIGPDLLIPGYRQLPPFSNVVVGRAAATSPDWQHHDFTFLLFRVLNTVIAVPILEELFWRGWLMRWIVSHDFRAVPLGKLSLLSFCLVALLFASEHGPYWDVGLVAGVIYNWWIVRTRNLWDCILAHATTNALLAAFAIGWHQWQYWL